MATAHDSCCTNCRSKGVTLDLVPAGTVFLAENATRGLPVKYVRHQPRETLPANASPESARPAAATA